jgi:hypothetical protein
VNDYRNVIVKGVMRRRTAHTVDCGICEVEHTEDSQRREEMIAILYQQGWIRKDWRNHEGKRFTGWVCPRGKKIEGC